MVEECIILTSATRSIPREGAILGKCLDKSFGDRRWKTEGFQMSRRTEDFQKCCAQILRLGEKEKRGRSWRGGQRPTRCEVMLFYWGSPEEQSQQHRVEVCACACAYVCAYVERGFL